MHRTPGHRARGMRAARSRCSSSPLDMRKARRSWWLCTVQAATAWFLNPLEILSPFGNQDGEA